MDPAGIHILPEGQASRQSWLAFCSCCLPGGSGGDPYPFRSQAGPQSWLAFCSCCLPGGCISFPEARPIRNPSWPSTAAVYQVDLAGIHILPGGQAGPQFWLFSYCDLPDGSGNLSYPSREARLSTQSWLASCNCHLPGGSSNFSDSSREPNCPHDSGWFQAAAIY